ncbi:MAG TPA: A/G-specific adenine glycosylase [Lacunisphaera sp.]|nr:A/G-specific adenine glycosylase [Lacunisphaera sp.]
MVNSLSLARRPRAFQRALHAWYRVHHRRLPWRTTPSLYRTVVSEFMLQQTQVKTVLPFFDRWMAALPDFAALAAAPEAQVLKLWEGLGYYSRARRLHALARELAGRSAPPRTAAGWRELPGIGPYTAAAIASIAFDEPAAVVDGNVVRILARLAGTTRRFRDGSEAVKHFTPLAGELIRGAPPGLHNQAMMELGATVCLRPSPRCAACPVARFCAARAAGTAAALPRFRPQRTEPMFVMRAFCLDRGRLLLRRRDGTAKRLAGLHELPEAADLGIAPAAASLLATKRRAITRFQITEAIHAPALTPAARARIRANRALEWIRLEDLGRITLSGPHRRWIDELLAAMATTRAR